MISEKTLQHPVLVLITFVLLGIVGIFTIRNTAISLMPDIDMPYLMVSASYTNAGPETVEKAVTNVIENSLVSLSGLKNITSTSREERSTVSLEFNYGTDLDIATNDVRDKLDRITRSLPDNVTPSIFKMDSNSMPIMRIALRGNRSADDLKQIAEDDVVDVALVAKEREICAGDLPAGKDAVFDLLMRGGVGVEVEGSLDRMGQLHCKQFQSGSSSRQFHV